MTCRVHLQPALLAAHPGCLCGRGKQLLVSKNPSDEISGAVWGGNLCWTAEDPEALGQTPPRASTARQGRDVGNGALGLQCRPWDPAPACGGSPIPEAGDLSGGTAASRWNLTETLLREQKTQRNAKSAAHFSLSQELLPINPSLCLQKRCLWLPQPSSLIHHLGRQLDKDAVPRAIQSPPGLK